MFQLNLFLLPILLLALGVSSNNSPPIIRQTANGPVEGVEKISSIGQKYYSFRGIPFAEAPITGTDPNTGEQVDRRFKAPEELKRHWTEPLKVHNFGKTCTQLKIEGAIPVDLSNMGEDCLHLNVHVPANGSAHKTVLVWIHGGAFISGAGSDFLYGPDFLLSLDNIVVTIQYRLGIFGFLNLKFGEYTGNMGLKDQQLALKWIHENIEHFSGNKSEVLIFGQSAGSVSVQFHMLNKESRSYFQRAFAASGSPFQAYVFAKANHINRIQGCSNTTEIDELIGYLKTVNSTELIQCPFDGTPDDFDFGQIWVPTVESNKTNGAFLTKTPEEIYTEEAPIMDEMFSFTSQELAVIQSNINASESSDPFTTKSALPWIFKGFTETSYPKEYEETLNKIRKTYFSNTMSIDAIKHKNADLLSDSKMNYKVLKTIEFQSKANHMAKNGQKKNTFLFRFNMTTDLNVMNKVHETNFSDAAHCDELCYYFHCHAFDDTKMYDKHLKSKDFHYDLIMRSVKMITNFARTGDPSIEGDTPFKSIHSIDDVFCQEIGNELKTSVTNDIRQQIHYDLWQEIEEVYKSLEVY